MKKNIVSNDVPLPSAGSILITVKKEICHGRENRDK